MLNGRGWIEELCTPGRAYPGALGAGLLSAAATWALWPWLHLNGYVLPLVAAAAVLFCGGVGPALVTIVVGAGSVDWLLVRPVAPGAPWARLAALLVPLLLALGFRRAYRASERARLALEDALLMRDDFIAVASHELRTPLTALALQMQVLEKQAKLGGGAVTDRQVSLVRRQLNRLTWLVNTLLDVSASTAGKFEIHLGDFDMAELMREVVARFEEECRAAGCEVVADLPLGPVVGTWDRGRIEEVVTNLLQNALKYGEKKPVHVSLEDRADGVEIVVKDQGIGIPPENLEIIFERFERAGGGRRGIGGLGLGLWISQEIVAGHGGRIDVISEPGRGSRFVVRLPRRQQQAA